MAFLPIFINPKTLSQSHRATIPANIFQSPSWRIFNLNFFSQCGAHASPMGNFNFLN